MPYQPFDLALHEGELAESEFSRAIRQAYVEHKDDRRARQTGNVYIEYAQRTGPSGIATTIAEFYAIRYDDDCWVVVRTSLLKKLAARAFREGKRRPGGDFDNQGVLVPIDWLLRPWDAIREEAAA